MDGDEAEAAVALLVKEGVDVATHLEGELQLTAGRRNLGTRISSLGRGDACFNGQHLYFPYQVTVSLAWWLRRPPRERKIRGLNPACDGIFPGRVIPVTYKLALQWLPCQAPGVIGSALGLVGPVSVYCDWVRQKVGSATSISVWQHVKLSVQICHWDTLACCWIVKQLTNKQTSLSSACHQCQSAGSRLGRGFSM